MERVAVGRASYADATEAEGVPTPSPPPPVSPPALVRATDAAEDGPAPQPEAGAPGCSGARPRPLEGSHFSLRLERVRPDSEDEEERLINLTELTPYILCSICKGYLIDATTITECLHTFCKSCIVRHFYYSNRCPKCNIVVHQTQPLYNIRLDRQLQDIVYKLVINLEESKKKQMHDFYKERGLEVLNLVTMPQTAPLSKGRTKKVLESPLEKKFVRVSGEATIGHVEKFLRRKMGLDPACQVDIICGDHLLERYQTLREIRRAIGDAAMQDGLLVLHYGLVVSPLKIT
uniref:Polycomb group RING finger protein 6 n=1 Tax=Cavia porcellus TaxID=10141 RepID=H0V277_CAVPO